MTDEDWIYKVFSHEPNVAINREGKRLDLDEFLSVDWRMEPSAYTFIAVVPAEMGWRDLRSIGDAIDFFKETPVTVRIETT